MSDPNIRVVKGPDPTPQLPLYTEFVHGNNYIAWLGERQDEPGYYCHVHPRVEGGPTPSPEDVILALEDMAERLREFCGIFEPGDSRSQP